MSWLLEHSKALGLKPMSLVDAAKYIADKQGHKILDSPEEEMFCPKEICKETEIVTAESLESFYREKIEELEKEMEELCDAIMDFDPERIHEQEAVNHHDYYTDEIERLKEQLNDILDQKQLGLIDISEYEKLTEELNDEIKSNQGALEFGEIDIPDYLEEQEERESDLENLISLTSDIVSDYLEFLKQNSFLDFDTESFIDDYYETLVDIYQNQYSLESMYNNVFDKLLDDIAAYIEET